MPLVASALSCALEGKAVGEAPARRPADLQDQDGGETSAFRKFKIPPTSPDRDEPLNWSQKTLHVVPGFSPRAKPRARGDKVAAVRGNDSKEWSGPRLRRTPRPAQAAVEGRREAGEDGLPRQGGGLLEEDTRAPRKSRRVLGMGGPSRTQDA